MTAEPTVVVKKKGKSSSGSGAEARAREPKTMRKSTENLVKADWEKSGGYGSPKLAAPAPTFSSSPSRLRETEFDEPALKSGFAAALSSLPTFNFSSNLDDPTDPHEPLAAGRILPELS